MPSSLIIVALVVAWLLVLVPIVARKRQEVARTADSTLAARVVHSGGVHATGPEEHTMPDADTAQSECLGEFDDLDYDEEVFDEENLADLERFEPAQRPVSAATSRSTTVSVQVAGPAPVDEPAYDLADEAEVEPELTAEDAVDPGQQDAAGYDEAEPDAEYDQAEYDQAGYEADEDYAEGEYGPSRPYRPGRGGFDPEAAAAAARAKYAFRQRIVLLTLFVAIASAVGAALVSPLLWWAHGAVDIALVGYLTYLRRQVRIEEEIRERRTARMGVAPARPVASQAAEAEYDEQDDYEDGEAEVVPTAFARPPARMPVRPPAPGTVVVDMDDEDPAFDELGEPDDLPYRRAVGE